MAENRALPGAPGLVPGHPWDATGFSTEQVESHSNARVPLLARPAVFRTFGWHAPSPGAPGRRAWATQSKFRAHHQSCRAPELLQKPPSPASNGWVKKTSFVFSTFRAFVIKKKDHHEMSKERKHEMTRVGAIPHSRTSTGCHAHPGAPGRRAWPWYPHSEKKPARILRRQKPRPKRVSMR